MNSQLVAAAYQLGEALNSMRRHEEALEAFEQAIQLKEDFASAHNQRGIALMWLGRDQEAMQAYRQAIALEPNYPEAHFNLGSLLLAQGDFAAGWPEFEWRWKCQGFEKNPHAQPLWDGSPFQGKSLLLQAEQGAGDCIQFVRYAKLVKAKGGKVVLESPENLKSLFETVEGVDRVISRNEAFQNFDLRIPLASLPCVFKTTLETIPDTAPYLNASPKKQKQKKFSVGIVWKGNPAHKSDAIRSIPLRFFQSLWRDSGIRFVSLQKDLSPEEKNLLQEIGTEELGSSLKTFADSASLIQELDLVISVDTATAHLAGALGKPVWLLLPYVCDWRWMRSRSDSPWYPSLKIFRQEKPGDWGSLFSTLQISK